MVHLKLDSAASLSHIVFLLSSSLLPLYPRRSTAGWGGHVADIYGPPRSALQCCNWPHNDANAQEEECCVWEQKVMQCSGRRWQILPLMNAVRKGNE